MIALFVIAVLACVVLHFSRRGSAVELISAIVTIAAALAIPVARVIGVGW